jgi:hydroxymethylpyrimidine/phosphomethylpyrimidine kinase
LRAVRRDLLPLTRCICPNRLELGEMFATEPLLNDDDAIAAARWLIREGGHAVLITGGYGDGATSDDLLVTETEVQTFSAVRSRVRSIHGTGCALTSVIAAGLAHGYTLSAAIATAKAYITAAIEGGARLRIGQGAGPVDHNAHLPHSVTAFRSRPATSQSAPLDAF